MPKRILPLLIATMAMCIAVGVTNATAADEALVETEHATGAAAGAHGEEAHGGGNAHGAEGHKAELIPDPGDPQTFYSALWVVIIFVVLLAILYPTAWKSVLAGLKAREERIRKDIADAEAARAKAESTLRDYTAQLNTAEAKVREMIASATAEGERVAAGLRTHAQHESEEIKERANRDIDAARKAALSDIYAQAAELSTNIASKILRRNLNADDQRELVNQSLKQIQTLNA
jgi:F-type H+-transporting ATPase subunit b